MRDPIAQVQLSSLLLLALASCGPLDPSASEGSAINTSLAAPGVSAPGAKDGELAEKEGASSHSCAAPLSVPAALAVPAGNRLSAAFFAQGAQIYTCQPLASPASGYAWTLKAPDAHLMDLRGDVKAIHYAGPTWESTQDGSKVVGAVVARANSPEAGAVPWLLLRAAQSSGDGLFGRVTYIQRLSTFAGVAPTSGCEAGTSGAEVRVPYSTLYYFYTAGRGTSCR